ncbi:unnamed protein product [Brassica oleracea]|uniref:(rape) hypothetical protein n=1 Tax=Brassica napus TaxID=3708 RepID=A0A816I882_BRANA|nr:unnamed protein product [Brassica napus]
MESLRVYVVPRRCAGAGGECGGGTRAVDELIETMMAVKLHLKIDQKKLQAKPLKSAVEDWVGKLLAMVSSDMDLKVDTAISTISKFSENVNQFFNYYSTVGVYLIRFWEAGNMKVGNAIAELGRLLMCEASREWLVDCCFIGDLIDSFIQ